MLTGPKTGFPDPVVLSVMTPALEQACLLAGSAGASAIHPVANSAFFFPVVLADTHTYTTAWWLNGATAAGNVDVGIYTLSGTTLTRVVASTAQAQAGVSGLQTATTFTTTTIGPGVYYLALSASLATATFWRSGSASSSVLRAAGCFSATASHPLPATKTAVTISNAYMPVFGFAESSAI